MADATPLGFPDLRILKDLRDKSLRSVHSNGVTKKNVEKSGTNRWADAILTDSRLARIDVFFKNFMIG
jgi:hypothetical protein